MADFARDVLLGRIWCITAPCSAANANEVQMGVLAMLLLAALIAFDVGDWSFPSAPIFMA